MTATLLGRTAIHAKANFDGATAKAWSPYPTRLARLFVNRRLARSCCYPGGVLLSIPKFGVWGLHFAAVRVWPSGESASLSRTLAFLTQELPWPPPKLKSSASAFRPT